MSTLPIQIEMLTLLKLIRKDLRKMGNEELIRDYGLDDIIQRAESAAQNETLIVLVRALAEDGILGCPVQEIPHTSYAMQFVRKELEGLGQGGEISKTLRTCTR